ncbi:hypothetical protein ASPTUDRAFT_113320 [Aspergillus tubingensis CBS 134.48]|uniref:Ribosome maturation protein SDO1/SBDS N-terminal domain-containing protein n=1 Tax=Aspergillus tubingensis (strain CBS 134.48) TaxID=767770 RepID=A0A1L9NPL6_ASPTC|nr:hypothetical protein ASPTUDRAFT_113320 [Aspergillus tubingensis CBS 134.48]
MPINQPSNQIKFTNVSVVRLKKGKKRFELACYKNKLLEYRSGAEKDLDNVLQVPTIFLSVSKAQTAPSAELTKAFGADTPADEIRQEILRKGEVQVGERERKEIIERVEKEVLDIVSGRLVDPTTKRVYTPGMISKALDQLSSASGQQSQTPGNGETDGDNSEESRPRKPLWTGVTANKSAKSQALEAMKALIAWQPIPVMRARMRLRVTCPVSLLKQSQESEDEAGGSDAESAPAKGPSNVKDKILSYIESIETQEVVGGDEWEVIGFAEPGAFKGLNEFVGNETRGRGRVEVLDMTVTHEE